jgi:3-hydroxybutyrate dehydrogenase
MYPQGIRVSIIYMGSLHSKEASLKAPYVTAKHGGRATVICPGFMRTRLVDKQIPERAKELGILEDRVAKEIMLKEAALFFAAFGLNALPGQSLVVSHRWFMQ